MIGLQFSNGLVGPVGMFDLVQLCLRESVVEVLNGHLIEGDHVLEFIQLKTQQDERKESKLDKKKKKRKKITVHYVHKVF